MPDWPGAIKYDCKAPKEDAESLLEFGLLASNSILSKGYCTVKLPLVTRRSSDISCEIAKLDEEAKFFAPPGDIVDGLLGEEGSTRIAELPERVRDEENVLLTIDAHLDVIANAISPLAPDAFGFSMTSRTPGLLHESGTPRDFFPYINQASALQWFQTFTTHRIMCLVFLGPESGYLEMRPFDKVSNHHVVETEPGMCVYLRADLLSHSFRAPEETYVLSCWFLQAGALRKDTVRPCFPLSPVARGLEEILDQPPENDLPGEVPRDIQRILRYRQRSGGKTAVWGASCKLPSDMDFWSMYVALGDGTDAATIIPMRKWDHEDFYDPLAVDANSGKMACRHCGVIEGLDLFDNKKFRISPLEAATLAPEQRQTLEVGYEVMFYAGFDKKDMEKTATGVYVGATWNEWNFVYAIDSAEQGPFGATSNMNAIPANRLSYLLGFNGASMSLDTEGASSLVAVCKGTDDLHVAKERRTVDLSLCLGVSFLLSPKVLLDHAASGFLTAAGRCMTFDESADGSAIGDACGGVLLAPLSEVLQSQAYDDEAHPVRGLISAHRMGNMGRSSSVTAPHAPTDQRLLSGAVEAAHFSELDVEAVECHGTGHLLWDAMEVASCAKVLRGGKNAQQEVLYLGALKSSATNARAAGGVCGLIKTLTAQNWGAPPPSVHLQVRSPHMDLESQPLHFVSEIAEFCSKSAFCCVTSKGFGGSVAHVITWGSVEKTLHKDPERSESMRGISFWPGGGGVLEGEAQPRRAYTIVGSWSAWQEPQDMEEEEADGEFGYTVTIGEHRLEQFHIRLDGDATKVLHPTTPQAANNTQVVGPSPCAGDLYWTIDCRPREHDHVAGGMRPHQPNGHINGELEHEGEDDILNDGTPGRAGDKYRVRLRVQGKWRAVSWERLPRERVQNEVPAIRSRYFIVANWNTWQLDQEMQPDPEIQGLFRIEVHLVRTCGEFQIVVNRDPDQVLVPSAEEYGEGTPSPVTGPYTALQARGTNWFVDGKPGDIFVFEYRIWYGNGVLQQTVKWTQRGYEEVTDEQVEEARRQRYFIVGSWNRWRSQEMTWNLAGSCFEFPVTIGPEGDEAYQIIMDNDWRLVLHPERADSTDGELAGPSDLSECDGVNWLLSGPEVRVGARFTIRLHVDEDVPMRTDWLPQN